MTAAERPWWATDGDAPHDPDADPMEAHRAARRGPTGEPDLPGPGAATGDPAGGDPAEDGEAAADDGEAAADDGSWWVPATEAVTRLARELAATTAERSSTGGARAAGHDPAGEPVSPPGRPGGGGGGAGTGGGGGGPEHRIDACGVCPICVGLRAIGDARPELVVHLAEAARQLALAVRTVVDAAAPDGEAGDDQGTGRRGARGGDDLHHIDLDD